MNLTPKRGPERINQVQSRHRFAAGGAITPVKRIWPSSSRNTAQRRKLRAVSTIACIVFQVMPDFSAYPEKLREVLEIFAENPGDRNAMLVEYSDQFEGVPERIATRPYPLSQQVPHCESETYVFVEPLGDVNGGDTRLKFYYAVENPFGVSARSFSAILDQTLSGLPARDIAAMPIEDLVPTLFGKNISMGKGQGLLSIASVVKVLAQRFVQGKTPHTP